jgi:hypothetical protein
MSSNPRLLLPCTSINGPTVARSQLLRPFPTFTGVTVTDTNVGKIWCNSLQVAVQKRYAHGLTFSANYTFSKNIQATSYANPQDATPTRVLTAFDRPQRLAFSPSYEFSVLGGAFSTRQTESHGAWSADGRLW